MTTLGDILDSTSRKRNPAGPTVASISRELTEEDLLDLAQPAAGHGNDLGVKELRASHHKAAKLLATGSRPIDVANATGYSTARIQQLSQDPQFVELVTFYKELDDKRFEDARIDVAERLRAITIDSLEVVHSKLLDDPNSFATKDLLALAELGLDRIGHGKTSTQNVQVSHSIDEEQLARIRASADAPARIAPEDRAALVHLAVRATETRPSSEEGEGEQGEGERLREESDEGDLPARDRVIDLAPVAAVSRD